MLKFISQWGEVVYFLLEKAHFSMQRPLNEYTSFIENDSFLVAQINILLLTVNQAIQLNNSKLQCCRRTTYYNQNLYKKFPVHDLALRRRVEINFRSEIKGTVYSSSAKSDAKSKMEGFAV
ncbi:hypothetical protein WMZ97_17660 [Lentibacillus sp. N15]